MARKESLKKWAINRFLGAFENSTEDPIKDKKEADDRLDLLCRLAIVTNCIFIISLGKY